MSQAERRPESDDPRADALFLGVADAIEEPSPHVDERVFAMARAELESRARGERRRVRWIELGVAAAVLLVAILLFQKESTDPGVVDPKPSNSPLASSAGAAEFATKLLDGDAWQAQEASTPIVAIASLRFELDLLKRIANGAPMQNESEKSQILNRLKHCAADVNRLEARLGTPLEKPRRMTPKKGDSR